MQYKVKRLQKVKSDGANYLKLHFTTEGILHLQVECGPTSESGIENTAVAFLQLTTPYHKAFKEELQVYRILHHRLLCKEERIVRSATRRL